MELARINPDDVIKNPSNLLSLPNGKALPNGDVKMNGHSIPKVAINGVHRVDFPISSNVAPESVVPAHKQAASMSKQEVKKVSLEGTTQVTANIPLAAAASAASSITVVATNGVAINLLEKPVVAAMDSSDDEDDENTQQAAQKPKNDKEPVTAVWNPYKPVTQSLWTWEVSYNDSEYVSDVATMVSIFFFFFCLMDCVLCTEHIALI